MRATLLIQATMIAASLGLSVSVAADPADVNLTKSALNVDFNRMIDGNNSEKKDIQKNLDEKLSSVEADDASDKNKVLDFVDVEVGWGDTPDPIVDRRFDSIGGPQPVDLRAVMQN